MHQLSMIPLSSTPRYIQKKYPTDLDSLVNSWYVRMAMKNPEDFISDSVGIEYSDSLYKQRITQNKLNH